MAEAHVDDVAEGEKSCYKSMLLRQPGETTADQQSVTFVAFWRDSNDDSEAAARAISRFQQDPTTFFRKFQSFSAVLCFTSSLMRKTVRGGTVKESG